MTERRDPVEPPLSQRSTQSVIVLAAVSACLFFATQFPKEQVPEPARYSPARNSPARNSSLQLELNQANVRELSLVPGIGPVLARRIVDNRQRLGDFPTLDSLSRVRGVGPRTIERVATICVVDDHPRLASKP